MKGRLFLIILLGGIISGAVMYFSQTKPTKSDIPVVTATIAWQKFRLHAPQTERDHEIGLAAFDVIAPDEGMIFRGMPVGRQSIWMKNMKFDIDVLWVNKDNQIIHIVQGMSKSDQTTKYHNPDTTPSAYVIELPNDTCNKYGITVGQRVVIAE